MMCTTGKRTHPKSSIFSNLPETPAVPALGSPKVKQSGLKGQIGLWSSWLQSYQDEHAAWSILNNIAAMSKPGKGIKLTGCALVSRSSGKGQDIHALVTSLAGRSWDGRIGHSSPGHDCKVLPRQGRKGYHGPLVYRWLITFTGRLPTRP